MNALSYYCTHPDDCGAYDHEDRGVPPVDDDDDLAALTDTEGDEYVLELIEEVGDLLTMEAERENDLRERLAQIVGTL